MSDLFNQVTGDQDPLKKLLSYIPGFSGYIERSNRRAADKLLRETIANRFEEQWKRLSGLQRDLISNNGLAFVDDIEAAALKLRQFIDRIKNASYGYSPLFDAVKINEDELALLYQHDLALLNLVEEVSRGIDNVEASLGNPEGLPASIRHLVTVSQNCVDSFNRRSEVITSSTADAGSGPTNYQ